jgi:hypothetical protein
MMFSLAVDPVRDLMYERQGFHPAFGQVFVVDPAPYVGLCRKQAKKSSVNVRVEPLGELICIQLPALHQMVQD